MRKMAFMVTVVMGACAATVSADSGERIDGRKEFEKHCAVCHPDGQNTINPSKPLNKKALNANGIRSPKDIIAKMRNPGPGMTKFDKNTIPDKEATAIADYILKTF